MHLSLLPALLVLAPGPRSQDGGGESKTLEAVPENVTIAFSIAPLDELRERAKGNAWFRMARDEELAPLFAKIGELVDRALDDALAEESEGLRTIADPRAWLAAAHGSISAFIDFVPPYVEGDAFGGVFLETSGDRAELDRLVDETIEQLREGSSESSLAYAGVDLSLFETSEGEPAYLIFFESEGVCGLLIGDRRDEVVELTQAAIDRLSGKDPAGSLASSERLAEARAASGPGRAFELFADVGELVRFGQAETHKEEAQLAGEEVTEPEPDPTVERFGLYDVRWFHMGADIGAGETADLHMALHLPEQSLLQQMSRFFGPAPRNLFALAPSDCLSAQVGNLDLSGMWEFVVRTFEELAPEQHQAFRGGLEQLEAMGIDVESDLIDQIGGDWMNFTMIVPAEEAPAAGLGEDQELRSGEDGLSSAPAVGVAYLFALEDGVVVEDFVERALEVGGLTPLIEFEEFQGHHLQTIEDVGLHWCFLDEYLAAAETPTPLRTALTRLGAKDAPSILSEERYRDAIARHPDASILHVGTSRAVVEAWFWIIESGLAGIPPIEDGESDVDLASVLRPLLPDPALVGKYLSGVTTNALEVGTQSVRMSVHAR